MKSHNDMNQYLVTAIVSTYKAHRFIRTRMENLVDQSLYRTGKLEIIVVDSSSPEDERSVVEEYIRDYPHIRYLRTQSRETLYKAWNRGIGIANSKYVINANTDDQFALDALESMASALESNPNMHASYGDWVLTEVENDSFDSDAEKYQVVYPDFCPPLLFYSQFSGHAVMIRKDVAAALGGYDEQFEVYGDRDFMFRFCLRGFRALRLGRPIGIFFLNPSRVATRHLDSMGKEEKEIRQRYIQPSAVAILFGYREIPEKKVLAQLYASLGSLGYRFCLLRNRWQSDISFGRLLLHQSLAYDSTNRLARHNLALALKYEASRLGCMARQVEIGVADSPEIEALLKDADKQLEDNWIITEPTWSPKSYRWTGFVAD